MNYFRPLELRIIIKILKVIERFTVKQIKT